MAEVESDGMEEQVCREKGIYFFCASFFILSMFPPQHFRLIPLLL